MYKSALLYILLFCSIVLEAQVYQSIDGTANNAINPEWGATETRLMITVSNGYDDLISTPAGVDRPNPRTISNILFDQPLRVQDHMGLSDFLWAFGQFLDHDIVLTEGTNEFIGIPVPAGDPYFDPDASGNVLIPMTRSLFDPTTGTDVTNPRIHINQITAWIDGSNIYGSDIDRAIWLRSFDNGKLKVSEGNLLPFNTLSGEHGGIVDAEAPGMAIEGIPRTYYFVAGDIRANEHVILASLHTLFVRTHNRRCEELIAINPDWTDEQLYQHARAYTIGLLQSIVYDEWLPAMGVELEAYSGYKANVNPAIRNVFASAAYRLGHTLINPIIMRLDENRLPTDEGDVDLKDAFFNPDVLMGTADISPYFRGMAFQMQQRLDCKIVDGLRNFLFGAPGAGGLDLAAININRGRERGLPDFNTIREDLGLPRFGSFQEICNDPEVFSVMEALYGSVDRIDPWVGMLTEDYMPDALFGETIMRILKDQFGALREGDRFFYKNNSLLTETEKEEIVRTRLSDIVMQNTEVQIIQDNVFEAKSLEEFLNLPTEHLSLSVIPNPAKGEFKLSFRSKVEGAGDVMLIRCLWQSLAQSAHQCK